MALPFAFGVGHVSVTVALPAVGVLSVGVAAVVAGIAERSLESTLSPTLFNALTL